MNIELESKLESKITEISNKLGELLNTSITFLKYERMENINRLDESNYLVVLFYTLRKDKVDTLLFSMLVKPISSSKLLIIFSSSIFFKSPEPNTKISSQRIEEIELDSIVDYVINLFLNSIKHEMDRKRLYLKFYNEVYKNLEAHIRHWSFGRKGKGIDLSILGESWKSFHLASDLFFEKIKIPDVINEIESSKSCEFGDFIYYNLSIFDETFLLKITNLEIIYATSNLVFTKDDDLSPLTKNIIINLLNTDSE